MKLPIPVVETIKKRHSVRTYKEKVLTPQDRKMLLKYMDQLDNPFGVVVKEYILDKTLSNAGEKLGTYGVIKGASTFLGISIPNIEMAPVAAGYEFENLILYATNMGLGTVWLAATFDRDAFSSAMEIPKGELFPAISPVGYPAEELSENEIKMRAAMKSSTRKEWEELFFQDDFHTPLTKTMAGSYALPLEMVRLAPSAKNQQPWCVLKTNNTYHFYTTYKQDAPKDVEIVKQIDIGIALSHFHQTVLEQQLNGHFEKLPQGDIKIPEDLHYIISWKSE